MKRNKMKKGLFSLAVFAVCALMLVACGGKGATTGGEKKVYKVGIVQLVEHEALDSANKGFVDGLAEAGFKEGENVIFDRQNAQGDQANLKNIADRFVNEDSDLILAIATPAVQTVAATTKDIPILGTAVTDYVAAKLVASNEKPGGNVSGTTDMNPVKEQLDLLLKIVPDVKNLGVIYTSSEVNSEIQVQILKDYAKTKNITVVEVTISNVNDIQQAAQNLVGKVDAVYVPTDNMVASAMPTLTQITTANKIPVLCGEANQVKSGGLITVGIDYYKLGVQTGKMAAKVLSGEAEVGNMPIEAQTEFAVVVNETAADALGIKIPADVLKGAEIIK